MTGPVRLPQRLCRDLVQSVIIALPQFANSVQRMVEVLIEVRLARIEKIELRPHTSTRFDANGKDRSCVMPLKLWRSLLDGSQLRNTSMRNVLDMRTDICAVEPANKNAKLANSPVVE